MATTTLNPSEIRELIKTRIEKVKLGAEARNEGTVTSVSDGIVRIYGLADRSEEHTSELQSLMRISYAVFCLKKTTTITSLPAEKHDKQTPTQEETVQQTYAA